ncbi:hypothetical protein [Parasulfitobacter algicola]|uniref:DUF1127 domain-containing protein n=1 Tax=Parasulfitobacter algicola TaxID=2614809 RepID=A0ABX2ITK6_9RHOB|nr:hypothetical protein [Sulfitobacter algicola]NSX54400.1 hypothetical protein [Sulfitobacter algicola]
MAYITDTQADRGTHPLRAFWDMMIRAREASLNNQGRVAQIEKLNAKTDAELKEIGINREDITRYVFRDLIYI